MERKKMQLLGITILFIFSLCSISYSQQDGTNLIKNGDFSLGKEYWEEFHSSKADDIWSIGVLEELSGNKYIKWERTRSYNDGGSVGLSQNLDKDISGFNKLIFSCDAKVLFHTLLSTGWWSELKNPKGTGEMPVKLVIKYEDINGEEQLWTFGFLITHESQPSWWLNPETGKREYKDAGIALKNFQLANRDEWTHYEIDLLSGEEFKDKMGESLPRPKIIKVIKVHGNGWDYAGCIDNVKLIGY